MRKLLIIFGLVLLVQLVWVSTSQAAVSANDDDLGKIVLEEGQLVRSDDQVEANPDGVYPTGRVCRCRRCYVCRHHWGPCCIRPRPVYRHYYPHPRPYCVAYHRVAPGQTLYGISRAYGVPTWAIARANRVYNWNYIQAGCTLCIPHP